MSLTECINELIKLDVGGFRDLIHNIFIDKTTVPVRRGCNIYGRDGLNVNYIEEIYGELERINPVAQENLQHAIAHNLTHFHKENDLDRSDKSLERVEDLAIIAGMLKIQQAYEPLVEMAISKRYVDISYKSFHFNLMRSIELFKRYDNRIEQFCLENIEGVEDSGLFNTYYRILRNYKEEYFEKYFNRFIELNLKFRVLKPSLSFLYDNNPTLVEKLVKGFLATEKDKEIKNKVQGFYEDIKKR